MLDIGGTEDHGAAHLAANAMLTGDPQDDVFADREDEPGEISGALVLGPSDHCEILRDGGANNRRTRSSSRGVILSNPANDST